MLTYLKKQAEALKKQTIILYLAYLHPRVAWYHKVFVLLILVYALSPVDLIPDFIPILGLLDDLILIPLGIWVAVRMIPKGVWQECLEQAEAGVEIKRKYKIAGAVLICLIWVLVIYKVAAFFYQ